MPQERNAATHGRADMSFRAEPGKRWQSHGDVVCLLPVFETIDGKEYLTNSGGILIEVLDASGGDFAHTIAKALNAYEREHGDIPILMRPMV